MKAKIELTEKQIEEIIKRDFAQRGIQISLILFFYYAGDQRDPSYTRAIMEADLPENIQQCNTTYDRDC